jgi:hypothetical protein
MTHAQQLHARLTTLGKVPEGLSLVCNEWRRVSGSHSFTVSKGHALAILCDAASEFIESHGLNTTPGAFKMWSLVRFIHGTSLITESEHDTRTEALIAGLSHLIEQKGRDDA